MASVLFVGCPDSYVDALPPGARVFAQSDSGATSEPATEPDLVVIGPSTSQPSALAQRAGKEYPGVDVLITAPATEFARLSDLLKVTPFIPLRTALVTDEPRSALVQAIREAVVRCEVRKGHRRILQSVQLVLEQQGSVGGRAAVSAGGSGGRSTDPEREELEAFFDVYALFGRELVQEVIRATSHLTASRSLFRSLPSGGVLGAASALELGRDAFASGNWGPYLEQLRTTAQAHAEMGLGFDEWLEIAYQFRRVTIQRLVGPGSPEQGNLKAAMLGMERFLRVTLYELERAHSRAQAELVGRYQSDAQLFAVAVESSEDAISTTGLDGTITAQNPAAEQLYGYSGGEGIGSGFTRLAAEDSRDELERILSEAANGRATRSHETRLKGKEGNEIDVALTVSPVRNGSGLLLGLSVIARDITEQKRADASLRQAQKMEAVGRLAGGIAHDFNNLLTVILTQASFLAEDADLSSSAEDCAASIMQAAERARSLTHQLLAFSHRKPLQPRTVDVGAVALAAHKLLRRTFPANIEVVILLEEQPWNIRIDPGRLDQLLMNLALNARDAMPTGGRLTIEIENATLSRPTALLSAGDYTKVSVADTGVGIAEADMVHVFEPFFTTKESGKGTGLGLATCYSIVHQAGGDIRVSSQLGRGTTFEVWLPRSRERASPLPPRESETLESLGGSETILVVEDEPAVLAVVCRVLEKAGYSVVSAPNGEVALRAIDTGPVALVLTDTVMPQMSGPELAERLSVSHPSLPVLFMTGYADDRAMRDHVLSPGADVLLKPFLPRQLLRLVRQMLGPARKKPLEG